MKRILMLLALVATTIFTSCKDNYKDLKDGLYADIETSKGNIIVELDYKNAPITVANFVTLAEGTNTYVANSYKGKKLFDGLKFHRVISKKNGDAQDFMIQTGDPLGNGSGDAGYKFKDEITSASFDKGGLLAMANSGPGTNGSQFFITIVETPWLNGKHTIFGHVVNFKLDVVNEIVQNDEMISVKIIRKGHEAENFDAVKVFNDYFKVEDANQKKQAELRAKEKQDYIAKYKSAIDPVLARIAALKTNCVTTKSGLQFLITKKGSDKKPEAGSSVQINYAGYLEDGTLFDSNIKSVEESFGKYNQQKDMQKGYSPIPFEIGRKDGMIPGFIEALEKMNYGDKATVFIPAELAYGSQGAGNGVIPPNANIIFDLEILDKQ
jgi:cyclophilin family peptidyl-prolyl cis-trans isomerase